MLGCKRRADGPDAEMGELAEQGGEPTNVRVGVGDVGGALEEGEKGGEGGGGEEGDGDEGDAGTGAVGLCAVGGDGEFQLWRKVPEGKGGITSE